MASAKHDMRIGMHEYEMSISIMCNDDVHHIQRNVYRKVPPQN
jgi:hypothetical protein